MRDKPVRSELPKSSRTRSPAAPPRLVADVAKGEEFDLEALLGSKLKG
jgi:hypothetical protein